MLPSLPPQPPNKHNTTGWVLAGGKGLRMGGVDKGMQLFRGRPLVEHAIERLTPQVDTVCINANRHTSDYESFGLPVFADETSTGHGPLSGFLCGLAHCNTDWLVTVPCDSPFFPLDLVAGLSHQAAENRSLLCMAASRHAKANADQPWLLQPVFCLMHRSLRDSLQMFLENGGHKITDWALHQTGASTCVFENTADGVDPFANANTLLELQALQR